MTISKFKFSTHLVVVGKSYLDIVEDLGGRGVEEHGLQLLTDAQPCPRMLTAHTSESLLRA